jgi:L-lysine 2,3-aminomutase
MSEEATVWKLNKPDLVSLVVQLREAKACLEARVESLETACSHHEFRLNVLTTALFDPESLADPSDYTAMEEVTPARDGAS